MFLIHPYVRILDKKGKSEDVFRFRYEQNQRLILPIAEPLLVSGMICIEEYLNSLNQDL